MKHLPGFVPVQYNKMGYIFVTFGIISLVIAIWSYLVDEDWINGYILIGGLFFIIVGLYLIKFVPKEKNGN